MLTVRVKHHTCPNTSTLYCTYLSHVQVLKAICNLANEGGAWLRLHGRLSAFPVENDQAKVADITITRDGMHTTSNDIIDIALFNGSQLYRLDQLVRLILGDAE